MKTKILSLALVLAMALTIVSVPVFSADVEYTNETDGIYMTPVTVLKGTDTVTVSMSAKKPEGDAENLMFILSLYENKKLTDVRIQTKSVGPTKTDFSVTLTGISEYYAGISGDYEINAALVASEDSFMPKGTPASYPAKEDAAELRELKVNGESVIDSLDENNRCKITLSSEISDYGDIEVMPYTMDSSSTVKIEDGDGIFPDKQTLTVTDTKGNSKIYTILYEYNKHIVKNADDASCFEAESGVTEGMVSKEVIASEYILSDGKLRTNLHGQIDGVNDSGSRTVTDSDKAPSTFEVKTVNDPTLVGCDYFIFESNWMASLNKNPGYTSSDNYTGNLIKFELTDNATIAVIGADGDPNLTGLNDGWKAAGGNGNDTFILVEQSPSTPRAFMYKYTKDYNKGDTVAIPYSANGIGKSRFPFVVIIPRAESGGGSGGESGGGSGGGSTTDPEPTAVITELTNKVGGITYKAYCEYAGETYNESLDSGLSNLYNAEFLKGENFGIGSYVGPNEQRTVNSLDSSYGFEGCEYIRFNNQHTYNKTGGEAPANWIAEAYSGIKTKGTSGEEEYAKHFGFTKTAAWSSFKVNKDCEVIVASCGTLSALETKGYTKTQLSSPAFTTLRSTNNEINNYTVLYKKSFNAGDTVEIYNCINGYNQHIYIVKPTESE